MWQVHVWNQRTAARNVLSAKDAVKMRASRWVENVSATRCHHSSGMGWSVRGQSTVADPKLYAPRQMLFSSKRPKMRRIYSLPFPTRRISPLIGPQRNADHEDGVPEKPVCTPEDQATSCPVASKYPEKARSPRMTSCAGTYSDACARLYNDGAKAMPHSGTTRDLMCLRLDRPVLRCAESAERLWRQDATTYLVGLKARW